MKFRTSHFYYRPLYSSRHREPQWRYAPQAMRNIPKSVVYWKGDGLNRAWYVVAHVLGQSVA